MSAVTAWISASAVLADEGAVLVKLDVDAVSVLGQAVFAAALALADGLLTDGALLHITEGDTEQTLGLQPANK